MPNREALRPLDALVGVVDPFQGGLLGRLIKSSEPRLALLESRIRSHSIAEVVRVVKIHGDVELGVLVFRAGDGIALPRTQLPGLWSARLLVLHPTLELHLHQVNVLRLVEEHEGVPDRERLQIPQPKVNRLKETALVAVQVLLETEKALTEAKYDVIVHSGAHRMVVNSLPEDVVPINGRCLLLDDYLVGRLGLWMLSLTFVHDDVDLVAHLEISSTRLILLLAILDAILVLEWTVYMIDATLSRVDHKHLQLFGFSCRRRLCRLSLNLSLLSASSQGPLWKMFNWRLSLSP